MIIILLLTILVLATILPSKLHLAMYQTNIIQQKVEHSLLITDKISAQQGQTCNGDSGGPQFISVNGEALLLSAKGVHGFWLGKKLMTYWQIMKMTVIN